MKKEKIEDLFFNIAHASSYGNLGLFIGSGFTKAIVNDDFEKPAFDWGTLLKKSADELNVDYDNIISSNKNLSYPRIASLIVKYYSEKKKFSFQEATILFKNKIADLTCIYPENSVKTEKFKKILKELNPKWIITTNYDLVLESLLSDTGISLNSDDSLISHKDMIPIFHLHGIRTYPETIIITDEDYVSLFRPNQYRQTKLALTLKESTTLMIGYGLGDVNVLTAVDWGNNVFSKQNKSHFPHNIIQLLHSNKPKILPYLDQNKIEIIEFNDLIEILEKIVEYFSTFNVIKRSVDDMLLGTQQKIFEYTNSIDEFIDDEKIRENILNLVFSESFLEDKFFYRRKLFFDVINLFSFAFENTWKRASTSGAFYAYDEMLIIILDVLEKVEFSKMPSNFFEFITSNFSRLSYYIGKEKGKSKQAHETWLKRKKKIPKTTINELLAVAESRRYLYLKKLLKE